MYRSVVEVKRVPCFVFFKWQYKHTVLNNNKISDCEISTKLVKKNFNGSSVLQNEDFHLEFTFFVNIFFSDNCVKVITKIHFKFPYPFLSGDNCDAEESV